MGIAGRLRLNKESLAMGNGGPFFGLPIDSANFIRRQSLKVWLKFEFQQFLLDRLDQRVELL